MKTVYIIKIGGNVIDNKLSLKAFLSDFTKLRGDKILVHGGGKLATQLSDQLGVETKMHEGRRITDEATLKITTMVYAGWINKSITAQLNAKKTKAIGLCGADVFIIPSEKRKNLTIDYGYVGDVLVNKINTKQLELFLKNKLVPVIAPITSDLNGQLLNTNADTIASSIAIALSKTYKTKLVYCFEKNGVLDGEKVIPSITSKTYKTLKDQNIVKDGMIPKLDNAFGAIHKGVKEVIIKNSKHILRSNAGTRITY